MFTRSGRERRRWQASPKSARGRARGLLLAACCLLAMVIPGACSVELEPITCVRSQDCVGAYFCDRGVCRPLDSPNVIDPAPEVDVPGAFPCSDGPLASLSGVADFRVEPASDGVYTIAGIVEGQTGGGIWYMRDEGGRAIRGALGTHPTFGSFRLALPDLGYDGITKLLWGNEQCTSTYVVSLAESAGAAAVDIRATVLWDAVGRDYELHLVKPGGQLQSFSTDCNSQNCIGEGFGPDWGVVGDSRDNPWKDRNDRLGFGPESIYLRSPEAGVYTVIVEHFGSGEESQSDGRVFLVVAGQLYVSEVFGFGERHVWTAATIDWSRRSVSVSDELIDCAADWSNGCRLALP